MTPVPRESYWPQVTLRNYRSYGDTGIVIPFDKRFTVLTGQNNSGKSNLLRFISQLSQLQKGSQPFSADDTHIGATAPSLELSWDFHDILDNTEPDELATRYPGMSFELPMPDRSNVKNIIPRFVGDIPLDAFRSIRRFLGHVADYEPRDGQRNVELSKALANHFCGLIDQCLGEVVYVPEKRRLGASLSSHQNVLDCAAIVGDLRRMQHPDDGGDTLKATFSTIERYVAHLLDCPSLKMEAHYNGEYLLLELNGMRKRLDSFGMGIHDLVILCAAIATKGNAVFCLEEPELHLHPMSQRRLATFLKEHTKNRFFISSHSSIFAELDDDSSLLHITHDGKASACVRVDSHTGCRRILDDLGYRASDILQCNGIIWVEGPSDRIYLRKFLQLHTTDSSWREGTHYSIMFYGGSLLSHLSSIDDADGDFIKLLSINKNNFVVMDSDRSTEDSALSEPKSRVQAECGDGRHWVTRGREIENYIPARVWIAVAESIGRPIANGDLGALDDVQLYLRDRSIDKNAVWQYDRDKARFARKVSEYCDVSILDHLDLKHRMDDLVSCIRRWNSR